MESNLYSCQFGQRFDLNELEKELSKLKPEIDKGGFQSVNFNLAKVRLIDLGALLYLICILNFLKAKGLQVNITLPESKEEATEKDKKAVEKVRDFLKRWRFDDALEENVDMLQNLLPEHQQGYFESPLKHYKPRIETSPEGKIEPLISVRLMEITSLTEIDRKEGRKIVSREKIEEYVKRLNHYTIRPIVAEALDFSDANVEQFSKVLIREGLLNTEEHPNATISLISMVREPSLSYLVIAIVDNGEGIPDTIRNVYENDPDVKKVEIPSDADLIDYAFDSRLIEYATQPMTTSKSARPDPNRGMGLYYLKTLSVDFGGYMIVRAGDASAQFKKEGDEIKRSDRRVSKWRGNLIKIFLPLSKTAKSL